MPGKEKMFENANVRETRETETPPSSELEAGFQPTRDQGRDSRRLKIVSTLNSAEPLFMDRR